MTERDISFREATLDEWCERLHPEHAARKELVDLRATLSAARERVKVLELLLRTIDADLGCWLSDDAQAAVTAALTPETP